VFGADAGQLDTTVQAGGRRPRITLGRRRQGALIAVGFFSALRSRDADRSRRAVIVDRARLARSGGKFFVPPAEKTFPRAPLVARDPRKKTSKNNQRTRVEDTWS